MLSSGQNLGLLVNGAPGEEHYDELMRTWRGLDGLIQCHAIDNSLTSPPGSPADGDVYIVPAAATGAWSGHDNKLARWDQVNTAWEFYTPKTGWRAYIAVDSSMYSFGGSTWAKVGEVKGPSSSTNGDFARFSDTSGKNINGGISLDTDGTLTANSDVKLASQKAVKTYVSSQLSNYVTTSGLSSQIGTTIQGHDSDLDAIADLSATNDDIVQRKSGSWTNRTVSQYSTDLQGDGISGGTTAVGFRGIPVNSQSSNYTLVTSDAGRCVYHPVSDASARVWTIPSNASVAFPVGTAITFDNDFGAGVITISITSDTLVLVGTAGGTGSRTLAAGGQATAIKVTSTRWRISGVGLT